MKEHPDEGNSESSVIRTLLYFDIFSYPLTDEEVLKYLDKEQTLAEVQTTLTQLVKQGLVHRFGTFYTLHDNQLLVSRREKGNKLAEKMLGLAYSKARFIGQFPYVRAVLASGSLSKGYMDEQSDLDFFIITSPGKLWLARTLLVVYKRFILGNSHKHFCVNYFIDSSRLTIDEQNRFTATELASSIPLYNFKLYEELMKQNRWIQNLFPNARQSSDNALGGHATAWKKMLEAILWFIPSETLLRMLTKRRWKSIYGSHYERSDFDIAFKSTPHVSKNHPRNFQRQVMEEFKKKLQRTVYSTGAKVS